MNAAETTLVLVFKRPSPGHGKQRLARVLGGDAACRVAGLMLDCALEDLARWPGPTVLAPDRVEDVAWARRAWPGAAVFAQAEGDLGERLEALDRAIAAHDPRPRLYIGSDSPGMTDRLLARAAAGFYAAPVVLVPARDGGVVAMGTARGWPPLADLPWSTERLGAALERRCRAHGHPVEQLGGGADIDTVDDLPALLGMLAHDRRPARRRLLDWLHAAGARERSA